MRTIGIVGAGRIARVHARHARTAGATEILVHDPAPEALAGFPGEPVPALDALIARADLVAVCTPNALHREIAERVLEAGKPVFIEKPVALTAEDGDALTALGGFVAIGHVGRFFPAYAAAHRQIASGRIGRVGTARLSRTGGFPGADGRAWYGDPARSGGIFVDLAIHDFDWLLWTLGPAARVYAQSIGGDGPDHGLATITMASGTLAHIEASWMDPSGFRTTFDLAGSDGLLEYDSRTEVSVRSPKGAETSLAPEDDPYARQWTAILKALDEGTPPPVGPEAATAALRLALAARESAETGRAVDLR